MRVWWADPLIPTHTYTVLAAAGAGAGAEWAYAPELWPADHHHDDEEEEGWQGTEPEAPEPQEQQPQHYHVAEEGDDFEDVEEEGGDDGAYEYQLVLSDAWAAHFRARRKQWRRRQREQRREGGCGLLFLRLLSWVFGVLLFWGLGFMDGRWVGLGWVAGD